MFRNSFIIQLVFCICFSFSTNLIFSQNNSTEITLSERLSQLELKFAINFSYNSSTLGEVVSTYSNTCASLLACLKDIEDKIPVRFEKNTENTYIVLPIRKDIEFRVVEGNTQVPVHTISVRVNNDKERYLFPKKSIYTLPDVFPLDSIHIHSDSGFYKHIVILAQELAALTAPLQLEFEEIPLSQVLINSYLTRGIDVKLSDHSFDVDMQTLGLLAGETDGDIFNVLKNIPGVHTPSSKPGSLNVRGGTFDQTLIYIDDIPVYHTGHFFGALSPYNPSVVDHIEVQRNTLSAKWGGRVGGMINMTTANHLPDSTSYNIVANTLYGGATIKTKLIDNKLGVLIAGRSNYPNINTPKLAILSELNLQGSRLESIAEDVNSSSEDFDVGFYDVNAKLMYDVNENHKVTISFINIQNQLSAEINDGIEGETDFRDLDLDNWGVTAKWKGHLSDKFDLETRLSRSSLFIANRSEGFLQQERTDFEKYENTISDTRFISELTYTPNEYVRLEGGYTLTEHTIRFDERIDLNTTANGRDQEGRVHSLYMSLNKNWSDKLTMIFGVHNDYYEPKDNWYFDPRISFSYKSTDAVLLKTSAGRSHQFIQKKLPDDFDDFNIQNQFWYLPDATTKVLESYQGMIGAIYDRFGFVVDLEVYGRNIDHITRQEETETNLDGTMTSIGADVFVKKNWGKLETWFSYSLNKVETDLEEMEPVFFDQRHILNLTGLVHINQWDFALSWGYFSGMPVLISDVDTNQNLLDIPYTNRFPGQHQLDVSATYQFTNTAKSWLGTIGLSVINVYNRDNIVNIFQNSPDSDNLYRKAIGFAPNLQLSFDF